MKTILHILILSALFFSNDALAQQAPPSSAALIAISKESMTLAVYDFNSRLLAAYTGKVAVLYPEKDTRPHVFYLGLDARFIHANGVPEPLPVDPAGRASHD